MKRTEAGAATLATTVILMLAGTILAFMAARIVLNETKLTANDYRTTLANEAAMAAIDRGTFLFNENNTVIDPTITVPSAADLALLEQCTFTNSSAFEMWPDENADFESADQRAIFYYANSGTEDRCESNGDTKGGTLRAIGWSDDCSARKEISVCIGSIPIFKEGEGPKQPVVTRAGIGAFGNASIINRYTNISIWAGESADVVGNSFATYLRPSDTIVENYEDSELVDENPGNNSQLVSNRASGFGIDVVMNDPTLQNLTGDQFWGSFFTRTKQGFISLAKENDTHLPSGEIPAPNGDGEDNVTKGQYWIDGDASFSGNEEWGSLDNPITIVVDGDLDLGGTTKITGMVYVTGELRIAGTPTVRGTVISENGPNTGAGTLNIVYYPMNEGPEGDPSIDNSGVIIPGSWKDWRN